MLALLTGLMVISVPLVSAVPSTAPASSFRHGMAVAPAQPKRDSMTVTIAPTKRVEVKLVMKKGQKANFEWTTNGAAVGFNLHGEVPTDPSVKAHVYKRGSSNAEKGSIEAVFDGVHGWSWRNTTEQPVTVTVKANGQFSALKKM
jgi:hypothetical protein